MQEKSKKNPTAGAGAFRFGEFDVYPSERQLYRRQKPVRLSPKAFDALLVLVTNAERLVRRDELINALWPDTHVTDANLTNIVVTLRKLLGTSAIQTVSKFGYRFVTPVVGEPSVDQTTYATFLKAKELVSVRSLESMARARDLLSLCVANDPMFAAAWAWLGRCARFLDKFGTSAGSVNLDLAQAALRRALAIDPHLACAHHFLTQLQIDLGHSRDAMVRLAQRIAERGDEPESYAGLVHALRCCGLLDESLVAHERATALDPAIATSVMHTHFYRCEYEAVIDRYTGSRYYLDAAAWAALGDTARARTLLQERLATSRLSPLMFGLMGSLVAVLESRRDDALKLCTSMPIDREPDVHFYIARHCALLGARAEAIQFLGQARRAGLVSSFTLEHDDAFRALRGQPAFTRELEATRAVERVAKRALDRTGAAVRLQRAPIRH